MKTEMTTQQAITMYETIAALGEKFDRENQNRMTAFQSRSATDMNECVEKLKAAIETANVELKHGEDKNR